MVTNATNRNAGFFSSKTNNTTPDVSVGKDKNE